MVWYILYYIREAFIPPMHIKGSMKQGLNKPHVSYGNLLLRYKETLIRFAKNKHKNKSNGINWHSYYINIHL